MKKLLAAVLLCLPMVLFAQNSIVQEGEFGVKAIVGALADGLVVADRERALLRNVGLEQLRAPPAVIGPPPALIPSTVVVPGRVSIRRAGVRPV